MTGISPAKKILAVYYTHKPGGLCHRLYRLLRALAVRGNEVHFLTLDPPPITETDGLKIYLLPFPLQSRRGLPFWALFSIWCPIYIFWLAFYNKYHRSVAFGAYYAALLSPTRIFLRIPLVLFLRSVVYQINRITGHSALVCLLADQLERIGIYSASRIVYMSQAMRRSIESFAPGTRSTFFVLPNDVPANGVLPDNNTEPRAALLQSIAYGGPEPFILLVSGVIDRRKNLEPLLKAVHSLKNEGAPILCFVAGDGPERRDLERYASQAVVFLGWVENMKTLIQSVDLVVHPSLHEGVSNSLLEALAADKPVLVSDIPEHRELLEYDELLFDLAGSPEVLVSRLREILSNRSRELRVMKDLCAKKRASLTFDWDERAAREVLG